MSYTVNELKSTGVESPHSSLNDTEKAGTWASGTLSGVIKTVKERTDLSDEQILTLAEEALREVEV